MNRLVPRFRPPFRITAVYDRLRKTPELKECEISIEAWPTENDPAYFPLLQYDTCQIWIRYRDFSMNVSGRLVNAKFEYQVTTHCDDVEWDVPYVGTMDSIDEMIKWIVFKYSEVPKGD